MAGLLTGSSFPMPSRVLVMWSQAVAIGTYRKFYRSFTAAGLSGIYTRFPFNPPREYGYGTLRYKDGKYLRIDKANHIN